MYKLILLIGLFCGQQQLFGQALMSHEEAMQIALENNYGIRLAKNAAQIAENNTSRYNTGELPSFRVNSGINYGATGSEISYHDANIPAASTWVANGVDYNAGISMNYLIYDFNGRTLNKDRLKELLDISHLEERQAIELNLLAVLAAYYNIAQIQENLYAQEEVLAVSRERKERAVFQFEYGKNNRLAVLNAEVDINRDSIDYLNLQQQLANEKRDLNLLLGRPVDTGFEIDTGILFTGDLMLESLLESAFNRNVDLLLAENDLRLSTLDQKINQVALKPRISAVSSLGLFGGLNDNRSTIKNQFATDFAAGVSLSWNLFDGGYTKVRQDNLKIAMESQQLLLERQRKELERDVRNAWTSYQNQLYIMEVEADNILTASLNFDRTTEQFRQGQVSSVEFRQAQLNRLYAQINYNRAKFIAKVNEIRLLQLSGKFEQVLGE